MLGSMLLRPSSHGFILNCKVGQVELHPSGPLYSTGAHKYTGRAATAVHHILAGKLTLKNLLGHRLLLGLCCFHSRPSTLPDCVCSAALQLLLRLAGLHCCVAEYTCSNDIDCSAVLGRQRHLLPENCCWFSSIERSYPETCSKVQPVKPLSRLVEQQNRAKLMPYVLL